MINASIRFKTDTSIFWGEIMKHATINNEDSREKNINKSKFCIIFILSIILLWQFFVHWPESKPSSFYIVYFIIFISLFLGVGYYIKTLFYDGMKIEKLFLVIIIPLGIIYTLLIPPGMVPDEWVHMQNSFSLASQLTGKEQNGKCTFRSTEIDLLYKEIKEPNIDYYNYIYDNILSMTQNNNYIRTEINSFELTQLFGYFPSVIGVIVARLFNLGAVTTVYMGRLFNFIFYILLTCQAIKKIPFGKVLLFAITMLPMVCHQMFTLSYDAVINASSFLCTAYGLFFVYQSKKIQLKDIVLYTLCCILLLANKGSVYAFIIVIPILAKYYNPNGDKVAKKTKIAIFLIALISILLLNYRLITDTSQITAIESTSEGLVPWSGTPSHSIQSLLNDIPRAIQLFLHTFRETGWWYITTMIGSHLGWLNILMPVWIINSWVVILILSPLSEKSNVEVFLYEHKLLYFLIAIAVVLVVMLAMALAWTPKEYDVIIGVQGRYFIPIIFLLLICLQNSKIYLKENMVKILLVIIPMMSVISIYNLIPLVL